MLCQRNIIQSEAQSCKEAIIVIMKPNVIFTSINYWYNLWTLRVPQYIIRSILFCDSIPWLDYTEYVKICPFLNGNELLQLVAQFWCWGSLHHWVFNLNDSRIFVYLSNTCLFVSNYSCMVYHSVESPSMVDPQWNILYWGSMWNLHSLLRCSWLWVG